MWIYRFNRTILVLTEKNLQSTSSLVHLLPCHLEAVGHKRVVYSFDWIFSFGFECSSYCESFTKPMSNCHPIRLSSNGSSFVDATEDWFRQPKRIELFPIVHLSGNGPTCCIEFMHRDLPSWIFAVALAHYSTPHTEQKKREPECGNFDLILKMAVFPGRHDSILFKMHCHQIKLSIQPCFPHTTRLMVIILIHLMISLAECCESQISI